MAKPTVYIETTIVSYLTAWPSRDVVLAGQQQVTRDWWSLHSNDFALVCSDLVYREASAGDEKAVVERVRVLDTLVRLQIDARSAGLAAEIIAKAMLPARGQPDALHVAIAATNGIQYLLTWNCRHLANAVLRPRIEDVCRLNGFEPPIICTPLELMP